MQPESGNSREGSSCLGAAQFQLLIKFDLSFSHHVAAINKSPLHHLINLAKLRSCMSRQDLEKYSRVLLSTV